MGNVIFDGIQRPYDKPNLYETRKLEEINYMNNVTPSKNDKIDGSKIGKRILVKFGIDPLNRTVMEFKVIEISLSKQYIKMQDINNKVEWYNFNNITIVDFLEDIEEKEKND